MKSMLVASLMLAGTQAHAAWTESVECSIERGAVDTGDTVSEKVLADLNMDGPHNGENGSVQIVSQLAPSYSIVYDKVSSGRNDTFSLTTSYGGVVARASGDVSQGDSITNRFVTANGDYQITVTCASR